MADVPQNSGSHIRSTVYPARSATGIAGLDDILRGGLTSDRLHLLEGVPGSGKTTLAMQWLLEGVKAGERVLYVTLSETEDELRMAAASHGWSIDGVNIHDIASVQEPLGADDQYTVFHPAEVELNATTQTILSEVDRIKPSRVVFDSLSEVRLLSGSTLRYRRQILALKRYFVGRRCSVLLLDDLTGSDRDLQVQSIAHSVIVLDQTNPDYGKERRRLRVVKCRANAFRGGYHDYVIRHGGLEVFPRLVASEHRRQIVGEKLAGGIKELDDLLGGGIEQGTSTLIIGPPGTGKSSLAAQFATAAAREGRKAAMFIFDESVQTLLTRATGLGLNLREHYEAGRASIQPIDPAELSPGEFTHAIRKAVEEDGASVVVIDSLNGYMNAMPDERFLTVQLHELLSYLSQMDVATLIVAAHQGFIGTQMAAAVDATYLADAAILLRFFEAGGEVRQAISIIKKRGGAHERTIREFRLETGGIRIGEPLREFRGVLTGVPEFAGKDGNLLEQKPR